MPLPPLLLVPSSSLAIYILEVTINILHNAHSTLHSALKTYSTLYLLLHNILKSVLHATLCTVWTLYFTWYCRLYCTLHTARCIVQCTLHAGDYKMLTMVHSTGQWHSGGRHCFVFVLPGSWLTIFGSIFPITLASMLFL